MTFQQRVFKLNKTYPQRTEWWSRVFATPVSHLILGFVGEWKILTPTRLTLFSFFLSIVSAILIASGRATGLLVAALVIQLSYILDCMDGQLARYRETSSQLGSFLDKSLDFIKFPMLIFALAWESYTRSQLITPIIYAFLAVFFACFLFYLKSMAKADHGIQEWVVLSENSFLQRNLRFFLFEEAQWYLFISVALVFLKIDWALAFFAAALGVLSAAHMIRVVAILGGMEE